MRLVPGVMLRVDDLTVRLGGREVLRAVSLDVHAGELVALVGPNGAGKTTLLAAIAGDLTPTAGTILLDGVDVATWRPQHAARHRAVLPQEHHLAFGFPAVEVVRMGRTPWVGTDREDDDEVAVAEAMARTDTLALAPRPFPTLSGGEKARVAFARVLAQQTALVLLDEPTAALDLRHQDQVLAEAHRLTRTPAAGGGTPHAVVAVVHDLTIAAAYADRICVLADGRLVADGAPVDVLTPELVGRVYDHAVDVFEHRGRLVVLPHRSHAAAPTGPAESPAPPHPIGYQESPWIRTP
jgi:iron complex transport system ATP-binding protein